ncbi:MAG: MFS transporter [Kineosporiaceae bacterium]
MPAPTDTRPDPGLSPAAAQRVRRRRQRAWYWYDWANSAYFTTTTTVLLGPYLTVIAKRAACPGQDTDLACGNDLRVLGLAVSPGSLFFYAITATTLLSALVLPVVGSLADRTRDKRRLLGLLAWVGAAAAMAMVTLGGQRWQWGVALLAVAGLAMGSSLVVYDAILCDVADPDERDRVSSRGWALGYIGGGLLLALNLGLVAGADRWGITTEAAVRISLLSAGVWWAGFTLVPFLGLRGLVASAPGPREEGRPGAFQQLAATLRHARLYPHALRFLVAYLFFNDGIQTVIVAASTFGAEELRLGEGALMATILVVQFVGALGALGFGRLARVWGAQRTIALTLALWIVVVLAGVALPERQFVPFLALGVAIGLVLGGSQALSRSAFSRLIPRGREAEYFSLYQAAERGTSWLGTLVFGLVHQFSGSYRAGIATLVLFFVTGLVLLRRVDVAAGEAAACRPQPNG